MNLLVRINLILGATLGTAALALGFGCWSLVQANAKQEVLREAGLMMDSALAIRNYTSVEIFPLLESRVKSEFLPQSVPFYAATQNFLKLREQHPAYTYKEATLNPTNPRDRAMDWEADLIQQFRNNPQTHDLIGERDTPVGRSLYLARPIRAAAECMECHNAPSTAPASLIARYGSDNGFGWQSNEIVGAHVVSVPLASATAGARTVFRSITAWIVTVLVLSMLVVNIVVYFLVVKPIRRIAGVAEELSVGNTAAGEFAANGASELSGLTRSFNRMRTSLEKALKLLEARP
jgi:HAMP domain-containing protein